MVGGGPVIVEDPTSRGCGDAVAEDDAGERAVAIEMHRAVRSDVVGEIGGETGALGNDVGEPIGIQTPETVGIGIPCAIGRPGTAGPGGEHGGDEKR